MTSIPDQSKGHKICLGIGQSSKIQIKVSKDGRSITIDSKEGVMEVHQDRREKENLEAEED